MIQKLHFVNACFRFRLRKSKRINKMKASTKQNNNRKRTLKIVNVHKYVIIESFVCVFSVN